MGYLGIQALIAGLCNEQIWPKLFLKPQHQHADTSLPDICKSSAQSCANAFCVDIGKFLFRTHCKPIQMNQGLSGHE